MGRAEDIFGKIVNEGETAIDEFILTRKSEELFLDFKRSADNGSGKTLHQKDRENLAKAISGFGNSEGGVVVWGIYCSKDIDYADVAHAKFSIQNARRFVSWLEGAVSGCTIPPHTGVRHHYILTNDQGDGFVITHVPKSVHAPHQVVNKLQYFIRAGSNFVPTPHAVLAGMFGRRPQPHVFHMFLYSPAELIDENIKMQVGFLIRNQGPGIASDLFMNSLVISIPGDNCDLYFEASDQKNWMGQFSFGRQMTMISKTNVRLAPESQIQPFVMTLLLAPPFCRELTINGICGCGQSPSYKFKIENSSASIEKHYNDFIEKKRKNDLSKQERYDVVKNVLRIEPKDTL